jgi:hypothetical protein
MRPLSEKKRVQGTGIDESFEAVLEKANESLMSLERTLIANIPAVRTPILFFSYAPRSGSTVISQYLAKTGEFHYVSNYIARFWLSPYFAGLVEKKLDMRNMNESSIGFDSRYGVTRSIVEPHEFGFFWNRWLPYSEKTHRLSVLERKKIRKNELKKEINALASLYDKPFFVKNGIAGINAGVMAELFPTARFLVIKRKHEYTAQSLLETRNSLYGNINEWWSLRPTHYLIIKDLAPYEQVVKQVTEIYEDIEEELSGYKDRVYYVDYEVFCEKPVEVMEAIFNFLDYCPSEEWKMSVPHSLNLANRIRIEKKEFERIRNLCLKA